MVEEEVLVVREDLTMEAEDRAVKVEMGVLGDCSRLAVQVGMAGRDIHLGREAAMGLTVFQVD